MPYLSSIHLHSLLSILLLLSPLSLPLTSYQVLPVVHPPAPRTLSPRQNKAVAQAMGGKFGSGATIHLLSVIWPQSHGEVSPAPPPLLSVSNPLSKKGRMGIGEGGQRREQCDGCLKGLQINKRSCNRLRRGRTGQMWGKGYFLSAVISGILKGELWIGDGQESVCQSHRGRDKDTEWAHVWGNCAHLHMHVSLEVWNEPVWFVCGCACWSAAKA